MYTYIHVTDIHTCMHMYIITWQRSELLPNLIKHERTGMSVLVLEVAAKDDHQTPGRRIVTKIITLEAPNRLFPPTIYLCFE